MPFQIVTDDEHGEGRSKNTGRQVVREGDMAYLSDMSDLKVLFNLKVYHTPHRKKKNADQKRLVGEQYMHETFAKKVVKKMKAKDLLNTESTVSESNGGGKVISLLRKIRKMKIKKHSEQGYQRDIIDRLHATSDVPKQIAVGKPLLEDVNDRDLAETLQWVIEYANENTNQLAQKLFKLTEEVATYIAWKDRNRIRKNESTDNASAGGTKKTQFNAKDFVPEGAGPESARRPSRSKLDKSVTGEKTVPLLDQLNRIDMLGFNRFVEAINLQEQLSTATRTTATTQRGKKNAVNGPHTPRGATGEKPTSFGLEKTAMNRKGVNPEASVASAASVIRPHPPSSPSTANRAGTANKALYPSDKGTGEPTENSISKTHRSPLAPARPSTTPHSHANAPPRRPNKSKPDSRTRTYTTGQGGDEDVIVMKMGHKDMALDVSAPPMRRPSDGGATLAESDDKSVGQASNVSTNFGSVQFEANKTAEKPKAYQNAKASGTEIWSSVDLYRHNPVFDTDQINQMGVETYKKRSEARTKELERWSHETEVVSRNAEMVSEKMVDAWEAFANIYANEFHKMKVVMNGKDFDRPEVIKAMQKMFSMDGVDHAYGKRGHNAMVDIASMKRRVKHAIYCKKMDFICASMWFVTMITRMRDHCRRTNHPLPQSCFKFLGAVYLIIQYGYEITQALFYDILEQTILDEDHKEIVVHRALRAIREHILIDAESFLNYLNSRGIQPCSELLVQVRENKVQKTRAVRAAHIKNAIDHDAPLSFSPRAPPGSVPRDAKSHRVRRVDFLPVNKSLNLIKEYSELNDYGETSNALNTPRPLHAPLVPKATRMMKATDVHPPTPSVSKAPRNMFDFPVAVTEKLDEKDEDEDGEEEEEEPVVELRLPSSIKTKSGGK